MTEKEQKAAAKAFAAFWKDKGYEKGESQKFWLDLLQNVYGVEDAIRFISFEDQVKLDHTSFIDGYIEATHVMIEQKGLGKDLRKGIRQSDGSVLSPFQQAKRYAAELPYSKRPRWIITCNFAEFLVYDMEKPNGEPEQILLKDLPKEYYRLQFLVDTGNENLKKEMEISLKAGDLVGKLYDAILKQYKNPDDFENLPEIQYSIAENALRYLADGGEMIYSTCTLRKAENNKVVEKLLANHSEIELVKLPEPLGGKFDGMASIFPVHFGSDGFFIAKMRKKGR